MAELTDENIVALALGVKVYVTSALKISPAKLFKLSEDKTIKELGKKIVLREIVRLARGEEVEKGMRILIRLWCQQQHNGGKRGRPGNDTKNGAINAAYFLLTHQIENSNLKPRRKEIIASLAEYFGVKQRRIYTALEPLRK